MVPLVSVGARLYALRIDCLCAVFLQLCLRYSSLAKKPAGRAVFEWLGWSGVTGIWGGCHRSTNQMVTRVRRLAMRAEMVLPVVANSAPGSIRRFSVRGCFSWTEVASISRPM